jgi:hypothetical protein
LLCNLLIIARVKTAVVIIARAIAEDTAGRGNSLTSTAFPVKIPMSVKNFLLLQESPHQYSLGGKTVTE